MKTGTFFYLLLTTLFVQAEPVYSAGEFAKQYRLCMLYEDATGQPKAGLVSKVSNKNFFLQVGESQYGLRLTAIRLEQGVALIEQNGELAELTLEGLNFPAVPAAISGGIPSALAIAPIQSQPQFFKRTDDSLAIPEHIQVALRTPDSEPQQPRITLKPRRTESENDAGGAAKKTGGNMVIQSVPQFIAEKMLAKGF